MFTSFNSTVIYTAHSLAEQAQLRELLDRNTISYMVSAQNLNAPEGLYPVISPDMLVTQDIDYLFYVKKKDVALAGEVIASQWHWEYRVDETKIDEEI